MGKRKLPRGPHTRPRIDQFFSLRKKSVVIEYHGQRYSEGNLRHLPFFVGGIFLKKKNRFWSVPSFSRLSRALPCLACVSNQSALFKGSLAQLVVEGGCCPSRVYIDTSCLSSCCCSISKTFPSLCFDPLSSLVSPFHVLRNKGLVADRAPPHLE